MDLNEIIIFLFLIIILLTASVNDIRFHKIPNWLTYPAVVSAIVYHTAVNGLAGFFFSIKGIGVGIAVMIIPYLMGGLGAGDAKLMGSVGGVLGPKNVFIAFLLSAIIGGLYAFTVLALHGCLKETISRYWIMVKTFFITKKFIYMPPSEAVEKLRLCYGLAISAGTLIFYCIWHFRNI